MADEKLLAAVVDADGEVRAARDRQTAAVEARAAAMRKAHEGGWTWTAIGERLGVSASRALQAARPGEERTARRRKSS